MATQAAKRAYSMAGISAEDVDIAEVHDCFTIAELFATEDLGLLNVAQVVCLPENRGRRNEDYMYQSEWWVEIRGPSAWCDRHWTDCGNIQATAKRS